MCDLLQMILIGVGTVAFVTFIIVKWCQKEDRDEPPDCKS